MEPSLKARTLVGLLNKEVTLYLNENLVVQGKVLEVDTNSYGIRLMDDEGDVCTIGIGSIWAAKAGYKFFRKERRRVNQWHV